MGQANPHANVGSNNIHRVILQFAGRVSTTSDTETTSYQLQVIEAPGRGWGGPMLATGLDANQVRAIRAAYRGFIARQQASGETTGEWIAQPLRQIGSDLFLALPESVQARLHAAQGYASSRAGWLHLILNFEPSATELQDLPWELLHDPHGRFFYSLRGGGLTRCVLLPTASKAPEPPVTQSILGCWAEPAGLDPLTDRRRYEPAPEKPGGITWLDGPASLRQLKSALESNAYDGLHLVAHGRVGSAWDFAIALEDENGRPHWLSPHQLALFLSDYPALRFLYLDVCAAGDNQASDDLPLTNEPDESVNSPGGAAGYLLGIGLPAVILMQDRIGQTAAGQMAGRFYEAIKDGRSPASALTIARRSLQLEQGDVIHWSVPALYHQKPTPTTASPLADWILDVVATGPVMGVLFMSLVLLILMGRLSFSLAQIELVQVTHWLELAVLLVACNLIPTLTAVATAQGQRQLGEKYGYQGRQWFPFLWHKYFGAHVWAVMAWLVIWLVWAGIYLAGWQPSPEACQVIWFGALAGLALAAHAGSRQAVRQDLLFRRVGFVLFRGQLMDWVMLLVLLLIPPFLPLMGAGSVWLIWATLNR